MLSKLLQKRACHEKAFLCRRMVLFGRFLILAALSMGISLLLIFWYLWLPKRPFLFLSEQYVESVQYCYEMMYGIPSFAPLYPDEQQKFIEALQDVGTGKRTTPRDSRDSTGGIYKPTFLITLKGGFQFYMQIVNLGGPVLQIGLVESPIPQIRRSSLFRVLINGKGYDAYKYLAHFYLYCYEKYEF